METEIWPNLIEACAAAGIPLVLANARMSEKSARGYARLKRLTRPAFAALTAVCAQSSADAERLRSLGAARVQVSGNLKFDAAPNPAQLAAGRAWREALGRRCCSLRAPAKAKRSCFFRTSICFPREFSSLSPAIRSASTKWRSSRSRGARATGACSHRPRAPGRHDGRNGVLLRRGRRRGDRRLVPSLGGQNLIESLAAGTPVILGPHMFNFSEATALALEPGAAIQVASPRAALTRAAALLQDDSRRRRMGEAGRKFCEIHRGAAERQLAVCLEVLKKNVVRP
jgi:3-deoxy-D-manno-octulosonic-acid transferase